MSSWWPLIPPRNSVIIYIYLYAWIFYSSCGCRTHTHTYIYIYIHRECRSVLVKLHPITIYRTILGVCGSCAECHVLFSLVSTFMSCSMMIRLILGCLRPLLFVSNNILTLSSLCPAISHLSGCFLPLTFFQNIGFNMVPSYPFMSHLDTQLGYFTREFHALQLSVLAAFGVMD